MTMKRPTSFQPSHVIVLTLHLTTTLMMPCEEEIQSTNTISSSLQDRKWTSANETPEKKKGPGSYLLARGARLGQAGLPQGEITPDDLNLVRCGVALLQQGAQVRVGSLGGGGCS